MMRRGKSAQGGNDGPEEKRFLWLQTERKTLGVLVVTGDRE